MEKLKELLNRECDRTMSSEEWDALFKLSTQIVLKKGDVLISPGDIEPDVYIVKKASSEESISTATRNGLFVSDFPALCSTLVSRFIGNFHPITRLKPAAAAWCSGFRAKTTLP